MRVKRRDEIQQYFWPVKNSGSAVNDGAALMRGVTADTDLGVLIPLTGAGDDSVGVILGAMKSTDDNTTVTGTVWKTMPVSPFQPWFVTEVEYDQSDTMAVASNSSTTLTITSLEDNIDTSWIYAVTGTGAGSLGYLTSSTAGSATQKTAMAYDSTTTVIKILRLFHQLAKINSTSDKIGTDAAAGSWRISVLQNWYRNAVTAMTPLNPTKHDNISGLAATGLNTKFLADVGVQDTGVYALE